MDWILNKKTKKEGKSALKIKRRGINTYAKQTLRYCLKCKKVWEISTTGSILFYKHLPTYGLPRKNCKSCNNLSVLSYERQKGARDDNA
tara:strand:+ start:460 stop:726 length:267 start_codon:yes stop_codon:yes gene_type:complete